jgi:hypothetical protein
MQKPVRKLLAVASVAMMTIGGLAIATPAGAGSWGGTMTCPGSIFVISSGLKGYTGPITVKAPGLTVTDTKTWTGVRHTVVGTYWTGSWSVTGSGAKSGYGYCGT